MRYGRWIAVAATFVAGAALIAPAGATIRRGASDKALLTAGVISAGVITTADVPAGWKSTKQQDAGPKNFKGIVACKQIFTVRTAARATVPRALSRTYADPAARGRFAGDTVYAFKNVKGAMTYLAAYQASTTVPCLQAVVQKATGGGQITVVPVANLQSVGDDRAGYEVTITGTDQSGNQLRIVADIIDVRVGRAVVEFNFQSADQTIPQGPAIVNAVISRVKAATG